MLVQFVLFQLVVLNVFCFEQWLGWRSEEAVRKSLGSRREVVGKSFGCRWEVVWKSCDSVGKSLGCR